MKALSVRQPWANDIAAGRKRIEWRTWRTRYRGPLLIVASLRPAQRLRHSLPFGQAVCTVELLDCIWDAAEGAWAWQLRNPRLIEPFQVKGRLGLYEVLNPQA